MARTHKIEPNLERERGRSVEASCTLTWLLNAIGTASASYHPTFPNFHKRSTALPRLKHAKVLDMLSTLHALSYAIP